MQLDLNRFFQACNPSRYLDVGNANERQYYIDFSAVRGDNIVEQLQRTITRISPNIPTCQLFTGHIGCGKSTELLRLKAELEQHGFHVVYFESANFIDLSDVDITDILLAIAGQISKSLESINLRLKPGYFSEMFAELNDFIQTPLETDISVGIAKITAKTKDSPSLRRRLRDYLEPRTESIIQSINVELLGNAIQKLKAKGKKGLVVIVDNLDRMDIRTLSSGRSLTEYLFIDKGEQLRKLNCHVVYTIPLSLTYSSDFEALVNRLGGGVAPKVLSMVPLRLRSGKINAEGISVMRQMLLARAFPDLPAQVRFDLITELFDSRETLDRLCLVSGGHVRNLLGILFGCIREVDPPFNRDLLEIVIQRNRDSRMSSITNDEWELLFHVEQQKSVKGLIEYQALVRSLFVFEYRDSQGVWFSANPLLVETPRFQAWLVNENNTSQIANNSSTINIFNQYYSYEHSEGVRTESDASLPETNTITVTASEEPQFNSSPSNFEYWVAGSLPVDAPTYVRRQVDEELYQALKTGQFCYVLSSRQTGKSSLRVQTMRRLQQEGIFCVNIDLCMIDSHQITPEQWYASIMYILVDSFNISSFNLQNWWQDRNYLSPVRRLSKFIEEVLLVEVSGSIIIFVEEIDAIFGLSFNTDNFFTLIRFCNEERAIRPEYKRLTFCLLGVATPSQLIVDKSRSPFFNIARSIELRGFQLHDVLPLAPGLQVTVSNPEAVLTEVLFWTGGQPFLTQKLCKIISVSNSFISAGSEQEHITNLVRLNIIENWESQDEPEHLRTIRDRLISNESRVAQTLEIYREILQRGEVTSKNSSVQIELQLSGLVVREQGKLRVYNPIYANIFNLNWVEKELAKLRPYADSINAWVASNYQDESCLLRGQALQDALAWSQGKELSQEDFRFLLASQSLERNLVVEGLNLEEVESENPLTTNTYCLIILISNTQLTVGQRSRLQVKIEPATSNDENSFQIPADIPELQCFVSADGLRVVDLEAATISIDPETGHPLAASFELQGYLCGTRAFSIELFVEDPESGKLSIFKYEGQIIVNRPKASQESLPILPALPTLNISVAPQANFVLLVETELPGGDDGSYFFTYYLTSRLRDLKLRQQEVGKVELQSHQLKRMRSLLARTVHFATNAKPEDAREQMISVGCFLFDMLFPAETTALLRDAFWQVADQISTWLIIEDGITWLPWELVVPYRDDNDTIPQRFLCERYFLSRWIQGLGIPLYNEVPLGEIAIAHYNVLGTQDEGIEAWKQVLQASIAPGIRQAVNPEMPFYGLHLLRYAEEFNRRDIVARDVAKPNNTLDEEVPKARLDLRLKRPIVTLSIINSDNVLQNTGDLTIVERALPYLRVGASAVVGCCWQTSEVAERIFWSQFYELLAQGFSLGEVVWRARLAVERALPHRLDWLAYTLFGDPCAKPYEPEVSSGYSVLECLNPDEPFHVGKTYYFRVSIRKRPPVWYKDKLIKTEELSSQLQALFMAPGLQTSFAEPVEMQPTGRYMRQATLSLNPQQEGDYPLMVQILEGEELVKTLQLNLKVRGQANG